MLEGTGVEITACRLGENERKVPSIKTASGLRQKIIVRRFFFSAFNFRTQINPSACIWLAACLKILNGQIG